MPATRHIATYSGRHWGKRLPEAPDIEQVLREHAPMLARLVAGYAFERSAREDLLQEISIALWQALPRWRGEGSLRGFVARVAHNRAIDTLAREQRHQGRALDEQWSDPSDDPQRHAEVRQDRDSLLGAVQRLPLGYRQAVMLVLEGFSQREIGQVLGLEENAVAQRLSRARRQLREWMGETA